MDGLAGIAAAAGRKISRLEYLSNYLNSVPLYFAAPLMILIGALDSSLLSLPEINDYLVVMRCVSDPKAALYFPLFAALGSVIGSFLLYAIMRRGGQAVLRRRFKREHIERVENAYKHYGILTLALPALLPPPMPFKIFVATAGALEYPRWRFAITIMIARGLRYYVEGILAVYYGRRVLRFLHDDGLTVLAIAAALCFVGMIVYLALKRFRQHRNLLRETKEPSARVASDAPAVAHETAVPPSTTSLR